MERVEKRNSFEGRKRVVERIPGFYGERKFLGRVGTRSVSLVTP